MGASTEHRWEPGERLPDGRWTPGTQVRTPAGGHAQVLPYATDIPNPTGSDAVFVQPAGPPERPWQLLSSAELTALPGENRVGTRQVSA